MIVKDYYKILQLNSNRVNTEQIKNQYKELAKKYHPDLNVGNPNAEELHRKVGKEIERNNIDILITAGEFSRYIDEEAKNVKEKIHLKDKNEVVQKLKEIQIEGDVILIKASNGMKFYEIVEEL